MTVDKAILTIQTIITNTLEEYDQSSDSQVTDSEGNVTRKAHPLDIIDDSDILFNLEMALMAVALDASPITLLETAGSTASELKRVSTAYFIRVPQTPIVGGTLDIDDGLAYAVLFETLGLLYSSYSSYSQKSSSIINTYTQAYRDYLAELIAGTLTTGEEAYIRFSNDGDNWHSTFISDDTYISFKKIDTDSWTPAILFVGEKGDTGATGATGAKGDKGDKGDDGVGGAETFIELSDTPASYTGSGGKAAYVKADETGIEFLDAPTGGSTGLAGANVFGDKIFFDDTGTGTLTLDASQNNVFYLYPQGNVELHFTKFMDDATEVSALWGTTYTFMIVSIGSIATTFDPTESILGDHSVVLGNTSTTTNTTMTILKMVYTGYDWYVVSKTVIADANG